MRRSLWKKHLDRAVFLIVVVGIVFTIGGYVFTGLVSQTLDELQNNSKIESKVLEEFEVNNEVDVIIILKDKPGGIRETQEEVISNSEDIGVKYQYNNINALSGEINLDTLTSLAENDDVEKILFDKTFKISLDESVPLINGDDVKSSSFKGSALKGAGQTVCVIDTGINYNHDNLGGCFGAGCKVLAGHDFVNNDSNPDDDNYHGSHVAGIIASNHSTYEGIAPEVNLVAIKACDSNGDCLQSEVIAGIDWCVGNKTAYNISVISMSIGDDGEYNSSTCPTDFDSSINAAVGAGIFVTVSSGNNINDEGISSPACSPNATSVGATDGSDAVWTNTNTGTLLDLLAPGVSIDSTESGNSIGTKSGTSMANAHVAGAAALIYQHYNLSGNVISPEAVESLLKDNGINRTDSDNGLSFPRINLESSILFSELVVYSETSTYPKTDANITFYGNYTNSTSGNAISSGSCNITYNNSNYDMPYDSGSSNFKHVGNFSIVGTYQYNITCNQTNYETLFKSGSVEVVQGSTNCTYPGSNIDWEVTDNSSFCVGENLIINQSNIKIDGSSTFVLRNTNISLIGASSIFVINVSEDSNLTIINSSIVGIDTSTKRLDVDIYGEGDIINSTFRNSVLRILGNKSHKVDSSTFVYQSFFKSNSTNTIINSNFSEYTYFEDSSINTIYNSTFEDRFYTYDSSNTRVVNSNLSGLVFFRENSTINFMNPSSNITGNVFFYDNSKVHGNISISSDGTIISGVATRFFPVFVYYNNTQTGYSSRYVNISYLNGSVFWEGTTDSNGFIEANITFNVSNYAPGNFTINTNSSQGLYVTSSTPIILEAIGVVPSGGGGGSSGGGGGGSGGSSVCNENWTCEEWSECEESSFLKSRICVDENSCGTEVTKPVVVVECNLEEISGNGGGENSGDDTSENVLHITEDGDGGECCLFGICWFKYILCWYWWIFILLIILVSFIIFFRLKNKKKKRRRK